RQGCQGAARVGLFGLGQPQQGERDGLMKRREVVPRDAPRCREDELGRDVRRSPCGRSDTCPTQHGLEPLRTDRAVGSAPAPEQSEEQCEGAIVERGDDALEGRSVSRPHGVPGRVRPWSPDGHASGASVPCMPTPYMMAASTVKSLSFAGPGLETY